jgi:hypothetical protein
MIMQQLHLSTSIQPEVCALVGMGAVLAALTNIARGNHMPWSSISAQSRGGFRAETQRNAKTHPGRLTPSSWCCGMLICFGIAVSLAMASPASSRQASLRVAMIGFAHGPSRDSLTVSDKVLSRLNASLSSDPRVLLVDDSIIRPALRGVGYDGSINMSRDEARRVGGAIGCDFFITGKLEVLTRSEHKGESHEEAFAGLMIVDGRTGNLAVFDFISEKATSRETALNAVEKALVERTTGYIDRIIQVRARVPGSNTPTNFNTAPGDIIEDLGTLEYLKERIVRAHFGDEPE